MAVTESQKSKNNQVHLVLQGKGGVGKSLIAAILGQYFQIKKATLHCFDTDPVNATFAQYQALAAEHINVLRRGAIHDKRFVKKKLCPANPCAGVEFPVILKGLFRPHYMTWSEQQAIEQHSPAYLRNVIRIVTETGLRIYKELAPLRKDQVDLPNKVIFVSDSKTPTGVAEVPLTDIAVEAFRNQMEIAGPGAWLFPSPSNPTGHQTNFRKPWETALRKAGISYFRMYDLRSTHATRLSAGGVADEWVTQMLR